MTMTADRSGLTPALHAEWTKLRSLRCSGWLMVSIVGATVLLTIFLSAVGHTDATRPGQGDDDVVVNSLRGVYLGQLIVVVFAVTAITAEHDTGMIRTTFTSVPRRPVVLAAKAAVLSAVVLVTGIAASVISFVAAQPLLHDGGFVPPAYPTVTLVEWRSSVPSSVLGSASRRWRSSVSASGRSHGAPRAR